jgi:hypothetical protein
MNMGHKQLCNKNETPGRNYTEKQQGVLRI